MRAHNGHTPQHQHAALHALLMVRESTLTGTLPYRRRCTLGFVIITSGIAVLRRCLSLAGCIGSGKDTNKVAVRIALAVVPVEKVNMNADRRPASFPNKVLLLSLGGSCVAVLLWLQRVHHVTHVPFSL